MLLAIDAGNTNVVFALVAGDRVKARWRIATDPRRTADEYAVWLSQLLTLEGFTRDDVTGVIVATVVPRALHNLQVLSSKYFKTDALIAGKPPVEWGIAIDVDEPASLGADRAVNTIAAHALHAGDLIVIDFGTATTVDLVDYSGAYKGGIIAPGINLSLDALVTARREVAADRDRDAGRHQRHRAQHNRPDAYRHLLGLCRDDRGAGRADEGGGRAAGEGHRDGRAGHPVRETYEPVRRHRTRPDDQGAGDDVGSGPYVILPTLAPSGLRALFPFNFESFQ